MFYQSAKGCRVIDLFELKGSSLPSQEWEKTMNTVPWSQRHPLDKKKTCGKTGRFTSLVAEKNGLQQGKAVFGTSYQFLINVLSSDLG